MEISLFPHQFDIKSRWNRVEDQLGLFSSFVIKLSIQGHYSLGEVLWVICKGLVQGLTEGCITQNAGMHLNTSVAHFNFVGSNVVDDRI